MRWLVLLLMVSASCATAKPKCAPKLSKACDPTQLEYWEDEMFAELDE